MPNQPSKTSHMHMFANKHSMPSMTFMTTRQHNMPTHTNILPIDMPSLTANMTTKLSRSVRSRGVMRGGTGDFTWLLLRSIMTLLRVRVEGLGVVMVVLLMELRVVVMGGSVVMGVEGKHE